MQSKKHKKRLARALAAAITAVTVLALVPVTALARPSGNTVLLEDEIEILVSVGDGPAAATAWGCDLTYDYVKINGDYRS